MGKRIFAGAVLAVLTVLLLAICFQNYMFRAEEAADEWAHVVTIDGDIIHGAGELDGYTTTNSLEALDAVYAGGARFVELDFALTSDGEPVCIHDWNYHFLPDCTMEDFPLSLEAFSNSKIYGKFTPVTLNVLADWLEAHEGIYIVTDGKMENLTILSKIAEEYPELISRMIPQIYAMDQLEPVRQLGYESIIFTVYLLDWEEKTDAKTLAAFAKTEHLAGITFPYELAEQEGYVEELLKSGVPLFSHTVNDANTIQQQKEMGITGVYTDYY
jgi:glycerophosphoryl diester phosphodiesterase